MSNELLLIGAGGHCRSCIDVIEQESTLGTDKILEFYSHFSYLFFHRHQPSFHGSSPCQETPGLPCLTGPRYTRL